MDSERKPMPFPQLSIFRKIRKNDLILYKQKFLHLFVIRIQSYINFMQPKASSNSKIQKRATYLHVDSTIP